MSAKNRCPKTSKNAWKIAFNRCAVAIETTDYTKQVNTHITYNLIHAASAAIVERILIREACENILNANLAGWRKPLMLLQRYLNDLIKKYMGCVSLA